MSQFWQRDQFVLQTNVTINKPNINQKSAQKTFYSSISDIIHIVTYNTFYFDEKTSYLWVFVVKQMLKEEALILAFVIRHRINYISTTGCKSQCNHLFVTQGSYLSISLLVLQNNMFYSKEINLLS